MTAANKALAALFKEAGFTSYEHIARALQAHSAGAEEREACNAPPRLSPSTIGRWVTEGRVPHPGTRRCVAALLSERLDRLVTVENTGWPDSDGQVDRLGLAYPASVHVAARTVCDLLADDLESQGEVTRPAALSVAAFEAAAWSWLTEPLTLDNPVTSCPDADLIVSTTARYRRMRDSGKARAAAGGFLMAMLETHVSDESTDLPGQGVVGAIAALTTLLTERCLDAGAPSVAQRYGIQALRLAAAAGDTALGSYLMAVFCDQALSAGEPDCALALARVGRLRIGVDTAPVLTGMLLAREAWALARLSARGTAHAGVQARAALGCAEGILTGRRGPSDPPWVADYATTHFPGEKKRCLRYLTGAAVT